MVNLENVDDCDVAQECGTENQFSTNGKNKKKNCNAACSEHCKSLMKIPSGESTCNLRLFDFNITLIHQKIY